MCVFLLSLFSNFCTGFFITQVHFVISMQKLLHRYQMTMRENRLLHRFSNRCLACRKTLHCCWACRMNRCCWACKRIPRCCSVCRTIHRCCCCSTAPDETSRSWSGYTCCNSFYNPSRSSCIGCSQQDVVANRSNRTGGCQHPRLQQFWCHGLPLESALLPVAVKEAPSEVSCHCSGCGTDESVDGRVSSGDETGVHVVTFALIAAGTAASQIATVAT